MEAGGCMSHWVDDGSVESHRYFLARRTILEMLRDRGYDIPLPEAELTLPQFRSTYGDKPDPERLSISSYPLSDPSKKVLVIFCGIDTVKLSVIRGIYAQVSKENLTRLILVLQSKMTSKAREAIKEIFKFKVEMFQVPSILHGNGGVEVMEILNSKPFDIYVESTVHTIVDLEPSTVKITELLVNITKHVLKPRHEILTEEQKQELLKKYSVEDKQLPRMLQTDAVARYYGLEHGQVVKVTYDGEITGSHVTFRCVM